MSAATNPVVLATGGSGGHVFPAQALAVELMRRKRKLALVTDRRGIAFGGSIGGIETFCVHASGVSGRGFGGRIAATAQIGLGFA